MSVAKYPEKFARKYRNRYPESYSRFRFLLNLNLNLDFDLSLDLDFDLNLNLFLFLKSFQRLFRKSFA